MDSQLRVVPEPKTGKGSKNRNQCSSEEMVQVILRGVI